MAIHNNNDFGGVGINAALEIAHRIARRNEPDTEADQPVDFAGLARFAPKSQSSEVAQPTQAVSRRATQPIICPEPNV
ncbi:MAG: hypothetical protein K8L91_05180 [Anaerolineae bacterium]|nr:hypothetical protein [Anaerolineae bacterium]